MCWCVGLSGTQSVFVCVLVGVHWWVCIVGCVGCVCVACVCGCAWVCVVGVRLCDGGCVWTDLARHKKIAIGSPCQSDVSQEKKKSQIETVKCKHDESPNPRFLAKVPRRGAFGPTVKETYRFGDMLVRDLHIKLICEVEGVGSLVAIVSQDDKSMTKSDEKLCRDQTLPKQGRCIGLGEVGRGGAKHTAANLFRREWYVSLCDFVHHPKDFLPAVSCTVFSLEIFSHPTVFGPTRLSNFHASLLN